MKKKPAAPERWFPHGMFLQLDRARVLGIDPSLSSTGWCLLQGGAVDACRSFGSALRGPARLSELRRQMESVLDLYIVDAVVVEGYSYGSSNNREALAEWGGVLRLLLFERGLPVLTVAPPTLRKFVLPSAKSGKDHMLAESFRKWGIMFDTSDECDAHALARLGALRLRVESGASLTGVSVRETEAAAKASVLVPAPVAVPRRRRP